LVSILKAQTRAVAAGIIESNARLTIDVPDHCGPKVY
jgi:hypothetical protein